ncbi:MAG: ATP-dependent DNA helicase RecG [Bacteroidota bacterium]|nr:ATP-dependent DNA helicase RecG [Bacteroidota bacterium]
MFSKELDTSVMYIKSVGPKRAEAFAQIGIKTVGDLLFRFPYKHLDRSTLLTSSRAYGYVANGFDGELTIIGTVSDVDVINTGYKKFLKVSFRDQGGFFECLWFQGVKYFEGYFEEGDVFAISGKPSISKFNRLTFTHPDYDKFTEEDEQTFLNTGKIIPVYSQAKELKERNIGELGIRKILSYTVDKYLYALEETLPNYLIKEYSLLNIKDAVKNYHFPESKELLEKAKYRFKFEELFYFELIVALRKRNYKEKLTGASLKVKSKLVPEFLKTLPFELTKAQLNVLHDIRLDMASGMPMNRLLQGDVGSGKTIVSLIAMLIAVDNGYQAVLMAPTEILADQHAKNISAMMKKLKEVFPEREVKVSLLLGGQKKSVRKKALQEIETKEADIIIGTHALFEEGVELNNLRLIIIDEQHRFGVEQRARLRQKGITPDILVMSATPIPRTLSMTVYGDLDLSIIDELPKNRLAIKTLLRGESQLQKIYEFIVEKAKSGVQSFIVYPLVEESDKLELKAAQDYYTQLSETYFKDLRVGLVHGKMKWTQKDETMQLFKKKEYDVLIATTVIEVGIDIPDANIMMINNAERFGLSQLHQLRGRVGRGTEQAFCILVTKDEIAAKQFRLKDPEFLSQLQLERFRSYIRLHSMIKYTDGFKLAEIDLKLRGPGNIYGTQQSGMPELKYADISKDQSIIIAAKQIAFNIVENDNTLNKTENILLKKTLSKKFSQALSYALIA